MDCSVIYYSARKTSLCEKALRRGTASMGLRLASSCFATDAKSLGDRLREAFSRGRVCLVAGGLGFSDHRALSRILSNAAARSQPDLLRRLPNEDGDDGYLLRAGDMLLVLLPDEPDQLERLLSGRLSEFIRKSIQ